MTATAGSPTPPAHASVLEPVPRPLASRPLGPDLVRSEWTKLRTVRSTRWTLLVTAASMVGLGALFAARYRIGPISPGRRGQLRPGRLQPQRLLPGPTGRRDARRAGDHRRVRHRVHSDDPRRHSPTALRACRQSGRAGGRHRPVGIASSVAAFVVGQAILANKGLQAHLGDPGVLRSVVGAGLYLAVLGLLALGIGTLIRSTIGATAVVVGLVFILPGIVGALPSSWERVVTPYLPSNAGQALIGRTKFAPQGLHLLPPWTGFAVVCAYAALSLLAAAVILSRRDA